MAAVAPLMTRALLRSIVRCTAALGIAVTLVGWSPPAHPIHTTLTVLVPDAGHRSMTVTIRAFADDFSATVAAFAGKRAPVDSSARPDEVARYVRAHFALVDSDGVPLPIETCGVRRANDLYWLCFTVTLPAGLRGVKVRNLMLTELHPDQVNIVQLEDGSARRSYLFTKGSAASALAATQ